jgi:hypothetical protein
MKETLRKLSLAVIVCQMIFVFDISARHKYHTSFTRIDYNRQEKLLEISIKVFAHDLVPALEKRLGKRVDLESEGIDRIIENYLAEKFVLRTKTNETKSFRWLGKEWEADVIYFYVEIPFEGELAGAQLKNTLFFEKFREQVNLIHIRDGDKKADLVFKVGESFKPVTVSEKKE